jgi:hypothetical protein
VIRVGGIKEKRKQKRRSIECYCHRCLRILNFQDDDMGCKAMEAYMFVLQMPVDGVNRMSH